MKNIILIEMNNYHDEVLYSAASSLIESGEYNISIITTMFNAENLLIKELKNIININILDNLDNRNNKFINYLKILKIIKMNKPDLLVFNTLEDTKLSLFAIIFLSKYKIIRVLHNVKRIKFNLNFKNNAKMLTELVLRNIIRKNIVLNYEVYKYSLENNLINRNKLDYSYFIDYYFNNIIEYIENIPEVIKKEKNKIYIGIQGNIEFKRRNYNILLSLLDICNKQERDNIRFILIGDCSKGDGPNYLNIIKEKGYSSNFIIYKYFLKYENYFKILMQCDFLMNLIDNSTKEYNETKLTSTENMSYIFKKYVIADINYKSKNIFKNIIYYNSIEDLKHKIFNFYKEEKEININIERERIQFLSIIDKII